MNRFYGQVGYGVSELVDDPDNPGVYVDKVIERPYSGNVVRMSVRQGADGTTNRDITPRHTIEIVADEYADGHFASIKYVNWAGVLWTVTAVEVRRPRLVLSLGEVYHGPTPGVA